MEARRLARSMAALMLQQQGCGSAEEEEAERQAAEAEEERAKAHIEKVWMHGARKVVECILIACLLACSIWSLLGQGCTSHTAFPLCSLAGEGSVP